MVMFYFFFGFSVGWARSKQKAHDHLGDRGLFPGTTVFQFLSVNFHDALRPCPGPTAKYAGTGWPALRLFHHGKAFGHR
jgi:hypothetical protein